MNIDFAQVEKFVQLVSSSGVHEVSVIDGKRSLTVTNTTKAQTAQMPTQTQATPQNADFTAPQTPNAQSPDQAKCITSGDVGILSLTKDGKPYVQVGDAVQAGDTVASVAQLGVLMPIIADKAGTVAAVLMSDGERVEYGQAVIELA
ncbi:hypothetical protein B0181_09695 [Moraxella caviae]|nr:biotin/lipoyl-containing protein [Moraxella caviae]OOR87720.1 hypothetical protein B0181_09695 [Moraxella caviae]